MITPRVTVEERRFSELSHGTPFLLADSSGPFVAGVDHVPGLEGSSEVFVIGTEPESDLIRSLLSAAIGVGSGS